MKKSFKNSAHVYATAAFLAIQILYPNFLKAQVIVTESFDQPGPYLSVHLPFGWTQGAIDGMDVDNYFDRTDTSAAPAVSPHSGAAMLRYRSAMTNAGDSAYICSAPLDFANGISPASFRFWMYRDFTNIGALDHIRVYINTSAAISGALLLADSANGLSSVFRSAFLSPVTASAGWFQYVYEIPGGGSWNVSTLHVIIVGVSDAGNDIFLDDLSVATDPINQMFVSTDLVFQNRYCMQANSENNWIVAARILTNGSASPYKVDSLNFNTNGSTNACADIMVGGAKLWYTGGTDYYDSTQAIQLATAPSACITNISFYPPPSFRLANGINYFWVTYNIAGIPPAAAGNVADAEYIGARLTAGSNGNGYKAAGIPTLSGNRVIGNCPCLPEYSEGTSWQNGSFSNNDYIQCIQLNGETGYPVINNCQNCCGPDIPPWNGGVAPFSAHPPDYELFLPVAGKTTVMKAGCGQVYTLIAQAGTRPSSNYIAAWIDYNQNNDFSDPGEQIMQSGNVPGSGFVNSPFSVPSSALLGTTLMRVREVYDQPSISPCNPERFGETEDYPVTIIPCCNILPGWSMWIGTFSDDWNVDQNWCEGTPTPNKDAAIIPDIDTAAGIQPPLRQPVIKTGVAATTKKLLIEGPDTLTLNNALNANLIAGDSLIIRNSNSVIMVKDSAINTVYSGNAIASMEESNPFSPVHKERMMIVYSSAELLSMGLVPGSIIQSICFTLSERNSTAPYLNFNISSYYTIPGYSFTSILTGWPPVALAPNTHFSGTIDMNSPGPFYIPPSGGILTIPFSTPLIYSGFSNSLVFDICWDNGFSMAADSVLSTMYLARLAGRMRGTANATVAGCAMKPGDLGTISNTSFWRPDICFTFLNGKHQSPFIVRGHWENNGTFIPGHSRVIFQGTTMQHIDGDSSTTFHQLEIDNGSHVRMHTPAFVNDTLWLSNGRFILNKATPAASIALTLKNGKPGAIMKSPQGFLQSEFPPPHYGSLTWEIGGNPGVHTVPFINSSGTYIPFVYDLTAGNSELTVATYGTNPNNLPLPTGVTNINGSNNGLDLVDRFWIIDEAGSGVNTDITFSFAGSEAAGCSPPIVSQRWDGSNWQFPTPSQTSTATSNFSPSLSQLNTTWALTCNGQALSLNLLDPDMHGLAIEAVIPGNGYVEIIFSCSKSMEFSFVVNEITGRTVSAGTYLRANSGQNTILISDHFADGIYLIWITGEGQSARRMFFK